MGWITRVAVLAILVFAFLSWNARGAEAAVSVAGDMSIPALYVELTGADANLSVTVNPVSGASSSTVTLSTVLSQPNRTVLRTSELAPGAYDVRAAQFVELHIVTKPPTLQDLQTMETEIARLEAGLASITARLASVNQTAADSRIDQRALIENATRQDLSLANISQSLIDLRRQVDLLRTPTGFATGRDVDAARDELVLQVESKSERLMHLSLATLAGQMILVGASVVAYVQMRRTSVVDDVAADARPTRGGVPESALIRRLLLERPASEPADLSAPAVNQVPAQLAAEVAPSPAPSPQVRPPTPAPLQPVSPEIVAPIPEHNGNNGGAAPA